MSTNYESHKKLKYEVILTYLVTICLFLFIGWKGVFGIKGWLDDRHKKQIYDSSMVKYWSMVSDLTSKFNASIDWNNVFSDSGKFSYQINDNLNHLTNQVLYARLILNDIFSENGKSTALLDAEYPLNYTLKAEIPTQMIQDKSWHVSKGVICDVFFNINEVKPEDVKADDGSLEIKWALSGNLVSIVSPPKE